MPASPPPLSSLLPSLLLVAGGLATGAHAREDASWANSYVAFTVRDGQLVSLRADPGGQGRLGPNMVLTAGFDGVEVGPAYRATVGPDGVTVSGLAAVTARTIASLQATVPVQVPPGAAVGRSFVVPEGTFARVDLHVPTWSTTDSAATIRLLREGPGGEVVAEARLIDLRDNTWQSLTFDPQPAGTYYIGLREVQGQAGFWANPTPTELGGIAYRDGEPAPDLPLASIRVYHRRAVGPAEVEYRVEAATLTARLRVRPREGDSPGPSPFGVLVPWDNAGYDTSARSVPFSRFFSDATRYLATEQLKRWVEREGWYELSLDGRTWIEAEGTGECDVRFRAPNPRLRWHLRGKETLLELTTATSSGPDGWSTAWGIEFLPRADSVPDDWPRFVLPDAKATEEANRFFWERALSYPPAWGPSPWYEWIALTRFWHGGSHLAEQRNLLETNPMTPEGYVYTWGGTIGWPFPESPPYDTRHLDPNARWILACWRYALWTGDTTLLTRQAERLRLAMEYQLTTLGGRETGLIHTVSKDVNGRHQGVGDNYWDILPFGGLDAYVNTVWYASLEAMAQVEEMLAREGSVAPPSTGPEDYRALAARAREAYQRTFWDEAKGRYIGCVDIDGKRHDYGFTFVNLEAMAYGLASPEQARRIYHWMETEPTSTGEADTYSKWIFAPRATTLHNPPWTPEQGSLEPDCPQEPWWMFGWRGTAFGDQCQDGGAILYTSYFDLMARARLVSPDNAWQRWEEILGRWRMPDHLCGGPPLIRGEHPQLIDAGSTGTDMPFPESGLVACWLLYGLAGVQPTLDGLVIAPNLPAGLPWLEVRNLSYRGLPLDLRVTRTDVTLTCRTEGYEFTWRRGLGADGRVVFRKPPPPVEFPREPLWSASTGHWTAAWIWSPDAAAREVWLRTTVDLPAKPVRSRITVTADNAFELFVNGRSIGSGDEVWQTLHTYDLGGVLAPGANVIALHARNLDGPAGVLAQGWAELPDGEAVSFGTGPEWVCTDRPGADWAAADADTTGWAEAALLGLPPVGPWGELPPPEAGP